MFHEGRDTFFLFVRHQDDLWPLGQKRYERNSPVSRDLYLARM